MDEAREALVLKCLRQGKSLQEVCSTDEIVFFREKYSYPAITRPFGVEGEFYSILERTDICTHLTTGSGIPVQAGRTGSATSSPSIWKLVYDGSVNGDLSEYSNSAELVSPKLNNTTSKDLHRMYSFIYGWKHTSGSKRPVLEVNPTCGVHVHLSVEHNSEKEKQYIFETFKVLESQLMAIIPDHRTQSSYCRSIAKISSYVQLKRSSKYHTLRISTVGNNDNRREVTFEYRMHSGTRNPNIILNWVRILDSIHLYGETLQASPSPTLSLYDVVNFPILWNYFNSRKSWLLKHGTFNEKKKVPGKGGSQKRPTLHNPSVEPPITERNVASEQETIATQTTATNRRRRRRPLMHTTTTGNSRRIRLL